MFNINEIIISYNRLVTKISYSYEKIISIDSKFIHTDKRYYYRQNLECFTPGYGYMSMRKLTLIEKIKYNLS